MNLIYQDIQKINPKGSIFLTYRPSALQRIWQGALQFSLLRTFLAYGLKFSGFGIFEKIKDSLVSRSTGNLSLTSNFKFLGSVLSKNLLLSITYFYAKQISFNVIDRKKKKRKSTKNAHTFCYHLSLYATSAALPIAYFLERQVLKSIRLACLIVTFSMISDLLILNERQGYLQGLEVKIENAQKHPFKVVSQQMEKITSFVQENLISQDRISKQKQSQTIEYAKTRLF